MADELAAAEALLGRLRRWNRRSWAAAAGPPAGSGHTRADAAHVAAQRLADLAAAAEGRPALPVPRLFGDLALPDQLAVMLLDVRRTADPEALRAAAAELSALRTALGFR
ncbi:MAG TPA: hypothetical protein VMU51_02050 [Mycobacteriales bacterium]|nr:hypothetical protein [Mycobacteriales bacterium]